MRCCLERYIFKVTQGIISISISNVSILHYALKLRLWMACLAWNDQR